MDDTSVLHILSISDSRCEGDIHIESCGEFSNELNGYSIILRKEKRNEFIKLVSDLFGEANGSVLRGVIDVEEIEDPEDAADLCKLCMPDGFDNYTEAFLKFYVSPSAIIEKFSSEKLVNNTRSEEEDKSVIVDVLEEQLEKVEDEVIPNSPSTDSELEELRSKLNEKDLELNKVNKDLEDVKVNLKDIGDKYLSSIEENDSLTSSLTSLKETYVLEEVPDFVLDLVNKTLGEIDEKDAILALKLVLQDYSSGEKNYLLSNLINDLFTKLSELEVISFE